MAGAGRQHALRDVWAGAATAAIGFEGAKTAFALYLQGFVDYSSVYASLGAVIAFAVFVFVTANILLLGAEVAVAWPRVRDGEAQASDLPQLGRRVARTLTGGPGRR